MNAIESFNTLPLQAVIPSYLYAEYSDDDDLQAFVASQNALAQGYLDWFNQTPLGLYISPNIVGPLLDWIGQGVYGISRPVLATQSSIRIAGYNSAAYNTTPYNSLKLIESGTATIATDDIYKRVMTWTLYRGDGQVFNMQWLKNRISRFLNGANGMDYPVLNAQPYVTVSGNVFSVEAYASTSYTNLQLCYANNALPFPFQYTLVFNTGTFVNDGGVLQLTFPVNYPISMTGLPAGSVWWNGGVVCVVPGITPNPSAPPVFFAGLTPQALLTLGGGNLPLTNPGSGTGQLWNNGGVTSIS